MLIENPVPAQQEMGAFLEEERERQNIEVVQSGSITWIDVPAHLRDDDLKRSLLENQSMPGLKVVFAPGRSYSRQKFQELFPTRSIAGDSSVEGDNFNENGYASFDHHQEDGIQREHKHSMCQLVACALQKNQLEAFRGNSGEFDGFLFINHLDADNGLAAVLLSMYDKMACAEGRKRLTKLARLEGKQDAYAGFYHWHSNGDAELLKAWQMPIIEAREKGGWLLHKLSVQDRLNVLERLRVSTEQFTEQSLEPVPLDERFEVEERCGWYFLTETGSEARRAAAKKLGLVPFVTYRGANAAGLHLYSFANLSSDPAVRSRFPSAWLTAELNGHERVKASSSEILSFGRMLTLAEERTAPDKPWGGDDVGGSYRGGSLFDPNTFKGLLDYLLAVHAERLNTGRICTKTNGVRNGLEKLTNGNH